MLVLHRRGSPSPDLVLLCTMILLAAIFDMVQLEGDLEMLAAGDSSKPEETESWVFTPCGPTVMGTQLPGVLWCPLSFPRVRLQGCGVTRVQVGLWVRPLTELTSPRLVRGLCHMGQLAPLNSSAMSQSQYKQDEGLVFLWRTPVT